MNINDLFMLIYINYKRHGIRLKYTVLHWCITTIIIMLMNNAVSLRLTTH